MADIKVEGKFNKAYRFFKNKINNNYFALLQHYGEMGVRALEEATPKRTGLTAFSWYYEIEVTPYGTKLTWSNTNVQKGWANVAILIQNGHATRNGGYVPGIDYINPALDPVIEELTNKLFKEVK